MYLALKLLHILAVVVFLGNVVTGLFWKAYGDRSSDPRIMSHTLEGIIRSDRWFTVPGVLLIVASGVALAVAGGFPILRTGWIWQSIALFTVSGLIFGMQVAPLQARLRQMTTAAAAGGAWDPAAYRRLSARFESWSLLALATPFGALVLMVFRP